VEDGKTDSGQLAVLRPPVASILAFDRAVCDEVAARVRALRPNWTDRAEGEERFYTLGRSCYLDLVRPEDTESYLKEAATANEMLWDMFAQEYLCLRDRLSALLGLTCQYDNRLALPGFHIWIRPAWSSRHFDQQYVLLVRAGLYSEPFNVGSFTVALCVPDSAYHLKIWDVQYDPLTSPNDPDARVEPRLVKYSRGYIYAHSGHYMHQVVSPRNEGQESERICIQGHFLIQGSTAFLYW
jgi:hypothetical protein